MNFNKLSISDLIDQQLPSFVVDQFPTFVKFFEEYYKSLEISGGLLDITDNILEYKNIDNLRKFNLVSTYKLSQAISETSDTIVLDNVDGLPPREGVIGIGNEVISYERLDYATKTLEGCKRGFTATTKFSETATTVSETVASAHSAGSSVSNLSNLILFLIIKNYEEQYLAGFPFENISSDIGHDTLIRNIKDFYSYKGTDISIEFLFRALFEEEVTVRYPKDYVIKSSYSDWTVDDIIKVESIVGDPYDLVGNELKQTDASGRVVSTALVDEILVNNIANYASGNKNIYEIRLNVLDQQFFRIPQESILRGPLSSTGTVITVDSTIGFPNSSGILQIDDEFITYRYKTFNQFIDCGRGAYGTIAAPHASLSPVRTTEYLYGYSGTGEQIEANKINMRLLGILGSTTVIDGGSYYNEGELIKLSQDGDVDSRPQFTTWRKNETGALASSSDVQINFNIKDTTTGVTAVYKDETYAYIASTGLPQDPIGDFIGTAFNVSNQNHLKTIPLQPEKNTQTQYTGKRPVGLFIDGVQAYSCEDYDDVAYGSIESVDVIQSGFGFETNIQPVFRIQNSTGSGATFSGEILNGKISKINVTSGGNNYTQDHILEVTYGFDATATISNDTDISNGSIRTITVTNSGQDYVATPSVEIIDITGKGKGAYAIAEVTNNQVTGIIVLNGGVDYSDRNNIRVNIVSKGTGVVARAVVKKWGFDRVFKTTHSPDTNGNWAPAQAIKSDTGNGYLYPSRNVRFNLEYGYPSNPKLLRHRMVDNVQGVNANYDEKTSGFTHSPILGWAYDGNPIYGPYGYFDPYDPSSGIARQTSSYSLITNVANNRPPVSQYPLGSFVDDYEFIQGSGSLDRNNGRFCKTPQFPDGRYCYFITVDNFGAGVFPYIVGTTFYSVPSQNNYNIEFDQSLDANLPDGVRRIRSLNTPSKGFDASLIVGEVQRGVIDSFEVYSSGDTFKKLDYLFIDNTDTEGSRAFGRVESVVGVDVPRVSYAVASGFTHPLLSTTNGVPNNPWPVDVSAPYLRMAGISYDIFVETAQPHLLSDGDTIVLDLDRASLQSSKTFKVRVSNYQTVNYTKPVIETELVADVAFNQNTINVISADEYREDDYLLINDEILKIVSIDTNLDQITVLRSQLGSKLRLHAATNKVSLYIPDDQPDYRIAVGDAITSPGVSGVIYSINKQNSSFEVRIISGSLTSSSTISDSSTPSPRDIVISDIGSIKTYWEIDPTNTGNYYVRDFSFRLIRGTQYTFDVSDGSNFGNKLIFTEDSTNINSLTNVEYYGTPGTVGSSIVITKEALLNFDVSRVYYYEQNNQILNNKAFFTVLTLPSGTQNVKVVNDNLFKFTLPIQPEQLEYLNVISYTTTSQTAIGKIAEVSVIDGGEGYKKLPKIEGITHSQLDDAKFTYSITNGSFDNNVSVISTGNRYSNDTKIIINTLTGSGAVLEPTIVGGRIISVNVTDPGDGYDENDTIVAVDTNCQIFAVSDSIGKIRTVRFNNNGSQFNPDRTLSKSLIFNKKVIVTNVQNGPYKLSETVTTSGGFNAKIRKIQEIGNDSLLLDLDVVNGDINVGDTLLGVILQTTSYVYSVTEPDVTGDITGFISKVGFFDSDLGKLSSSSQKITDSYYYQDFSYVIRSTKGLSDYKKYVDETTHPLGFKLFGEVSVENDVDFEDTVSGAPFSIGFADDPFKSEVIITLPNIQVESDVVFKKYEISRVNTATMRSYTGSGAALLNFLDNQIEATQIADLSSSLNQGSNTYTLTTNDGNFPIDTSNTSVLLALNEVFQEPFVTGEISGISYANGIATITTNGDHNLATTAAGETYPNQKYIHIEGVTYSGNLNFNDKFEVYDVPSSDSLRVLFNNPNGFLTNNDPAVCADVQSTVDNLTGILTTAITTSGYQLPASNQGIWLDPATSTIVSANRHRDAANLIYLNRQEIVDRANAEIAVQYPDFYYPNDPQTTPTSRYKDSYRLIQLNRQEIIDGAFAEIAIVHPTFVNPNSDKCKRDIGYFIDAISLDVHTGGNVYARKFLRQYFNANGTSLTSNGLAGEVLESITAFNKARDLMKDAITNQLTVQDLTITPDPLTGSNTDPSSCADVRSNIDNLVGIVTFYLNQGSLTYPIPLVDETIGTTLYGSTVTFDPSDNQTYTINSTSYPVMGSIFVPDDGATLDLVIAFHGTLPEGGTQTIAESSEITLDVLTNPNGMNIRDKIIFSVAYPQDHISQSRQYNLPGVGREEATFIMGSNLPYARAAVEWAKSNIVSFLASQGITKSIGDVYMFGHSQGGKIVTKLNTIVTGIAGVVANAPGPIQFDQTCIAFPGNYTCSKIAAIYGPASSNPTPYTNIGLETYTTGHNAPILFTQALDDTTGGGNQSQWLKDFIIDINSNPNPTVTVSTVPSGGHDAFVENPQLQNSIRVFIGTTITGEAKCKRDLRHVLDAVVNDLRTGGNSNIVTATQSYVDGNGNIIANSIDGEVNESVTAFNKARDLMKLALANQLYGKDFNILPDFLGTSGTIDSADIANAIFIKGQFAYDNANLKLYEAVKEGTTFYSIFFKFVSGADDVRYSYKVRDILFNGTDKEFPLLNLNGSNIVTEPDENLLVFVDGVLQIYGESYIIDRSVNPNVIKFYDVYDADRQFFAYTFSKYKILNNFTDEFDGSKRSFELKFGDDNILPPDTHQILVLLDGVPQVEGKSYSIIDNVLTFTEAPTKDKNCHILYFYGKTFDKTVSIWNGEVFERIQDIGERTPDGCKYYSKIDNTIDIIQPGDLIKIDGETTKEIIGIEQRTLENTDNLVYTAFVYTDNSYIRGKNAVASAVVSGVPVVGGNTVTVSGTVAVSGTTAVPAVFDYQVTGVNITNSGLEYDVAPIVLFKTNCDNPGKGAEAYAEITNGKVTNVVITNPGGGYTEPPELIFAKKYEIIRPQTPIFTKQEVVLDVGLNDKQAVPVSTGFNVVSDRDEEYLLPIVISQLTSSNTTVLEVENKTNRETSQPGLAYVLNTFDQNKFKYEPINLNDPLAPYLGTGVTIEMMNTYAPALTVGDFETHAGSPRGAIEPAIINIGFDSYISYGLTLTNSISNLATTITVTGDVSNFPPTGYLEFGNETIEYTSISGQDFTVVRGSGSIGHSAGDYLRLAWRG